VEKSCIREAETVYEGNCLTVSGDCCDLDSNTNNTKQHNAASTKFLITNDLKRKLKPFMTSEIEKEID